MAAGRRGRRRGAWRRCRDGLDSEIAERGRTLSGGQRQRIALARALAAHAPVLVLHDPTTAVDAATEHRIATGVAALRAGRTTVLVRPARRCWRAATACCWWTAARSSASGTHAELVTDERYRQAVLA